MEDAGQLNVSSATVYATACAIVFAIVATLTRGFGPHNS